MEEITLAEHVANLEEKGYRLFNLEVVEYFQGGFRILALGRQGPFGLLHLAYPRIFKTEEEAQHVIDTFRNPPSLTNKVQYLNPMDEPYDFMI